MKTKKQETRLVIGWNAAPPVILTLELVNPTAGNVMSDPVCEDVTMSYILVNLLFFFFFKLIRVLSFGHSSNLCPKFLSPVGMTDMTNSG